MQPAWEAASAAAGALMLLDRASEELQKLIRPRIEVITPRTARLIRVPDLQTLHRTLIEILPSDPSPRGTAPSSCPPAAAAEELRRTIENLTLLGGSSDRQAVALPDLVTRGDFYRALAERLESVPPLLTEFAREVLLSKAVRATHRRRRRPPVPDPTRPYRGNSALYDELRRRHKTMADFERLMVGSLEPSAEHDRGASRLLQQTVFLASAFERFERAVGATGLADEHSCERWR